MKIQIPTPTEQPRTYRCHLCRDIGFILRIEHGRHHSTRCLTCQQRELAEKPHLETNRKAGPDPDL